MIKKYFSNPANTLRLLVILIAGVTLVACASMGRPEGGPRDEIPPVYVRSNPTPGQLNFNGNKIVIEFDENIALDDPTNKVVVSPAQTNQPVVSALGRKVSVELRDTLLPNTTYTVDFADAIKDLNESNILDGFAIDFATGDSIDSLQISGIVLEARNLELAQGMLVGVYSDLSDTALTTRRFDRIAKTNQLGQFTIRNLKPGDYRIFAVNDVNRDMHWDRSEDVAFYDMTISPSSRPTTVTDTLEAADGSDSLVTRGATLFLPNDILLTWFNENYKSQYLVNNGRPERNRIDITFGAPSDTLPRLRPLNGPMAGRDISEWSVLNASAGRDTLQYWITDSLVIKQDSLLLEATYLRTDTLDRLTWTTDTLRMFMRPSKAKKKGKEKKNKDEETDSVPKIEFNTFTLSSGSTQELNQPIVFKTSVPLARLDTAAIKMQMMVDTLWTDVAPPRLRPQKENSLMTFIADYDWKEGTKYRLTVDSASVYDIYGLFNKPIVSEFTTKKLEDYSKLILNITGLAGRPAVAELLSGDNVKATVPVVGDVATFDYVAPGPYYVRLYIDTNGNGVYDTGNIAQKLQPEEVYYYPKKITLKKNWDVQQTWDIYEIPVDMQKPIDIKKNKPKKRQGEEEQRNTDEDEDEMYDPSNIWGNPYGGNDSRNNFGGGGLRDSRNF